MAWTWHIRRWRGMHRALGPPLKNGDLPMMSPRKVLVSVAALIGLLASAHAALAQECVTAADCGKGFTCELTMATPVAV